MTREEKKVIIDQIAEKVKEKENFYIAEYHGLTVDQVNSLRRKCFELGIEVKAVKNTLIKKALEQLDTDYTELLDSLKKSSLVFFPTESLSEPAKVISKFRKDTKQDLPILKSAFIQESVFLGDDSLEELSKIKSKEELLGELIGMLQSPVMDVLGALESGKNTITGILDTIADKNN